MTFKVIGNVAKERSAVGVIRDFLLAFTWAEEETTPGSLYQ